VLGLVASLSLLRDGDRVTKFVAFFSWCIGVLQQKHRMHTSGGSLWFGYFNAV
jgi:hypothetical protein